MIIFFLFFKVPVKFDEKYGSVQVKRGEAARLVCNASGDRPLDITWTRKNVKLEQLGSK